MCVCVRVCVCVCAHMCGWLMIHVHVLVGREACIMHTVGRYMYLFTGMELSVLVDVCIRYTSIHFPNIIDSTVTDMLDIYRRYTCS